MFKKLLRLLLFPFMDKRKRRYYYNKDNTVVYDMKHGKIKMNYNNPKVRKKIHDQLIAYSNFKIK